MTELDRIKRLERCFLNFAAILSGELQRVTTKEEFEFAQQFLAKEMTEMREGL